MINIDEIVDLVNSLEHEDEKLGAQDALQKILEARMAEATLGGGGTVDIKPPEEIEVDPDLEEIEISILPPDEDGAIYQKFIRVLKAAGRSSHSLKINLL
jgi:hypothetical protein